jgi:hypothetical protein
LFHPEIFWYSVEAMGTAEDTIDAAASFIEPYLEKGADNKRPSQIEQRTVEPDELVEQALQHLQAVNASEQAKPSDAPYDGSLVGVIYGLLDLITSLGVLPFLSPGVAFGQRPRSVLVASLLVPPSHNDNTLVEVLRIIVPIIEAKGSGVQPLLNQRVFPDIVSGIAQLAFSPRTDASIKSQYEAQYEQVMASASTSRLLPIYTSYLQQDIPSWLRQRLAKELAMVPLRKHGIRHTVEFLSLSYFSKNSQVPQEAAGPSSQTPIPLEAITQASRLLASVPSGMDPNEWFNQLAPQFWSLLDGLEGVELSRAAGHMIAGILNRRTTGAPGTVGWELFAKPILQRIDPGDSDNVTLRQSTSDQVIVGEQDLLLALRRLSTMVSSYSHPGLIKRLVGPSLLSLWGLMTFAKSRPSLDAQWTRLPRDILKRYMSVACEPKQVDQVSTNLFWDGQSAWTFGPGSYGGVEIRRRTTTLGDMPNAEGLLSRIGRLDERVKLFVSLLVEADVEDEAAGAIFVQTTRRWLSIGQVARTSRHSLTNEEDVDPLSALTDAKLSEALATKFKDKFAHSPQHIIDFLGQLLQNFVEEHRAGLKKHETSKPSRSNLGNLLAQPSQSSMSATDTESEDLVSFALSILNTVVTSPDFKNNTSTTGLFSSVISSLQYLSQPRESNTLPPQIMSACSNLLMLLKPSAAPKATTQDPLLKARQTLQSALRDISSPEPPNRTWALSTLRGLIRNPSSLPTLDIPSLTHTLLSTSLSDPESYVHLAAIPVLVDLLFRAPNPTLRIMVDAFVDIDERSLKLKKEADIEHAVDFRLRIGEVLSQYITDEANEYWAWTTNSPVRFSSAKMIVEAVLAVASRRGQRKQTLSRRNEIREEERRIQEEGEEAWGGPIPNLLDPEGENPVEQRERDALLKIVQGWEDTGVEEDVRLRASAMSILSGMVEKRLEMLNQVMVDAALQMVLQIVLIERDEAKAILRRAAVLVVLGLLRAMDALLEVGEEASAGMGMNQTQEVERVIKWVKDEDGDDMVKGHAESVTEGLETWKMKKLFKIDDERFKLSANLGLENNLRGLDVNPNIQESNSRRSGLIVEEID